MLDFAEINNPFPGLRPFETDENNLFFGRDGQSDELLERLRRTRFLAVVGTSGSGKSSLIRAGLLPALYGGLMGGAGSAWRIAIMRPGNDPIGNLADALGDDQVLGVGDKTETARRVAVLRTLLRRSTLGLVECVRQARMQRHENLLIVVDQFEELFRFKKVAEKNHAEGDAAAFVKLLLEAARHEDMPVYIVLTMRSDFLGDCAQFSGLPEAINSGQYLIPRMTRGERREAITGPVAVGGGEIAPPLVNRLLNDMGDNPDHLPTLQHALMRSWDYWTATRRDGEPLDLEHYEAVGGMANALSKHADEAYDELADDDQNETKIDASETIADGSGEGEGGSRKVKMLRVSRRQKIAERLFKSLTEKGADNREIRRPTRLGDICAITGASEREVVEVIDTFRREGRSFLMPPAGVVLDADSVIDISHESLIRGWGKLKKWVNEEAESARIYRRLADAATRKAKGTEEFWGGPNLLLTLEWREQNQPNAAWAQRYKAESDSEFDAAMSFLDESWLYRNELEAERARQRAAQVERERQELERTQAFAERQAQAARRLRWLTVALLAISVLAAGTAVYGWTARARAKVSEAEAIKNRDAALIAKNDAVAAKLETEKQAKRIAELLESEKVNLASEKKARDEADKERDRALKATKAAEAQTRLANQLKIVADTRARDLESSNAAMLIAQRARNEAENARQKAQQQTEKSQVANRAFRDAAATYQRDPDQHTDEKFIEAVKKFEEIGEADGVAASYLQLGYINLNSKNKNKLADGVKYFEEAAKKYLSMSDPASAAATYESSGDLLLKPLENSFASDNDSTTLRASLIQAAAEYSKREMSEEEKQRVVERKRVELEEKRQDETRAKRLAAAQYRQAIKYYGEAGNKQGVNETLGKLLEFYGSWDDPDDKREAIKFFDQLIESSKDTGDVGHILKIKIGLLYYDLKEEENGDKYLNEVVKGYVAQAKDEKVPEADAFSAIVNFGLATGQYRLTDKYTEKAAQIYQRERLYASAAQLFRTIAEFYWQIEPKNYAKALEYYEKAAANYQTGGDAVQQADVISSSAAVHRMQGNNDLAVETYKRSLALYRTLDDAKKNSDELTKAADGLKELNEYELALAFYQEAVKVSNANGYPISRAYALQNLGQMHSLMNQPDESIKAYQQAADIYRQENSPEQVKQVQAIIDKLRNGASSPPKIAPQKNAPPR